MVRDRRRERGYSGYPGGGGVEILYVLRGRG